MHTTAIIVLFSLAVIILVALTVVKCALVAILIALLVLNNVLFVEVTTVVTA